MFYLWHVNDLVRDLKNGVVTEYEKMRYLLFALIIDGLFHGATMVNATAFEIIIARLFGVVELGILIWGVFHCYRMNKIHGDDKNFIERFTCLSVPLCIKFIVISLLILIPLLIISAVVGILIFGIAHGFSPAAVAKIANHELIRKISLLIANLIVHLYLVGASILFYHILGNKIAAVSSNK
jgi:ABC-type multidrug transport system permease subunit